MGGAAGGLSDQARDPAARPGVPQSGRRPHCPTTAVPTEPGVVSRGSSQRPADLHRLLQHGVRVERSAPHLLRRTRQCRRRPAQGLERSGRPARGVGLLYQQGYFRQIIDADGAQRALYPYNDPGQLPITPVRDRDGEWVRLKITLPGYALWLRAWQAQVGRVKLYLLDSNDPANLPTYRGITSE